jgi:diguanylate cyclase (GGDEF)-like protein
MDATTTPSGDDSQLLQIEGLMDEVSSLLEMNERLKQWVIEAETRSRKVSELSELADLVLSCRTVAETGETVTRYMTRIFPGTSGTVRILRPGTEILDRIGAWGSLPPEDAEIALSTCVALRRGDTHLVADTSEGGTLCEMIHGPVPPAYLCVPLRVAGENGGVLHIRFSRAIDPSSKRQQKEHHDHVAALSGTVAAILGLAFSNIALRAAVAEQAIRDPLTGLFNRRFLAEAGARELSRLTRSKGGLSVLLLDVDGFKAINESCGYPAGDAVLRDLSGFLRRFLRGGDIPCRWGADEFLLLLPEASLEGAVGRAEKLREAVDGLTFTHGGVNTGSVTVSIGVASWPENGHTLEEVVRSAEMALEDARRDEAGAISVARTASEPPPAPPSEDEG